MLSFLVWFASVVLVAESFNVEEILNKKAKKQKKTKKKHRNNCFTHVRVKLDQREPSLLFHAVAGTKAV